MTEGLFWFFLVVGPLAPGQMASGHLTQFPTRHACWTAHAQLLADKEAEWLSRHLVTPCGPHPAVLVPKSE